MGVTIFVTGCFVGAIIAIFLMSLMNIAAISDNSTTRYHKSTNDKSSSERILK